jgi:hypothetical protein
MGTIVTEVIDHLQTKNIRTDEAYPGGRIPALNWAVAAVRMGQIDSSVQITTVYVTIMSPARSGGGLCEQTALQALEALQEIGGTCRKDICKFDEMADVFYIEIEVEFFGETGVNKWTPGPGYEVTVGIQPMPHVVSFSTQRAISENVTSINQAKWQFTMEELLPPGTSEPPDPAEPFLVTVERKNFDEILIDCTWVSVKREDTARGIRQIRTGIANKRSVVGIL